MTKRNEIISIHDVLEEPKYSNVGFEMGVANWETNEPGLVNPVSKGWGGFFKESKNYVGYNTRKEKIAFWKGLPRAWIVFHWMWFMHFLQVCNDRSLNKIGHWLFK